jgi:polar amino acid transport system substrate-binding protein
MPAVLRRPIVTAGIVALTLGAAAACGSSSSGGDDSTVSPAASSPSGVDAAAAALVPAPIKSKGTITIAMDATYAPNEFIGTDGKTVQGMDADLGDAIGKALGLKVTLTNETFDGIIPGIDAGKYDVGMSSFTDTKLREKTVDFVDYFQAGTSFFENAQGGPTVTGLDSLCGLKVAVEKGTTQQDDATAQGKTCKKAGKPDVTVDTFPDQNGANLALQSGHDQVGMADSPVAAYQVKQSGGQFTLAGTAYGVAPYGIALPQGTGLTQAVEKAVQDLIDNGSYTTILTKWGVESGAIKTAAINQAIS